MYASVRVCVLMYVLFSLCFDVFASINSSTYVIVHLQLYVRVSMYIIIECTYFN